MSSIPMTNIETPHTHDVLCGRGGATYRHVGNITFRYLILLNKPAYVSCKKFEKTKIARAIVDAIRKQDPPGRFLAYDKEAGVWNDVGDIKATEKTSQGLRERQPDIKEKIAVYASSPNIRNSNCTSSTSNCTSNLVNSDRSEDPRLISKLYSNNRGIGDWLNKYCPTKNESSNIWSSSTYTKSKAFNYATEKPLARKLYNEEGKGIEFVYPINGSNKKARKELKPNYFLIGAR